MVNTSSHSRNSKYKYIYSFSIDVFLDVAVLTAKGPQYGHGGCRLFGRGAYLSVGAYSRKYGNLLKKLGHIMLSFKRSSLKNLKVYSWETTESIATSQGTQTPFLYILWNKYVQQFSSTPLILRSLAPHLQHSSEKRSEITFLSNYSLFHG